MGDAGAHAGEVRFAEIADISMYFAKHHGEIYAYLVRMLRDGELAADLTQHAVEQRRTRRRQQQRRSPALRTRRSQTSA